ncbi:MAG: SCP2 sterol-binding domain-containing protein, partial [Nitrospiria bacterium]
MLVVNGSLDIGLGPASRPNVIMSTDGETLANVGLGRKSLKEVMAGGDLKFEGNKKAVQRMIGIFNLGQTRDRIVSG